VGVGRERMFNAYLGYKV